MKIYNTLMLSPTGTACSTRTFRPVLSAFAFVSTLAVISGCQRQSDSNTAPSVSSQAVGVQPQAALNNNQAPSVSGGEVPGQWGAFNEVLRSGGVFKNFSGKYLKLTFAPLGDSMDAIFTDAPNGKVTVTDAKGNRSQATYSLERDRTLTITTSGKPKKTAFELSKDGHTLNQIGGGYTLKLQP